MAVEVASPTEREWRARACPSDSLHALRAVDLNELRELTFPYAKDLTDVYGLTTSEGIGRIDAATGVMLTYVPHSDGAPDLRDDLYAAYRSGAVAAGTASRTCGAVRTGARR